MKDTPSNKRKGAPDVIDSTESASKRSRIEHLLANRNAFAWEIVGSDIGDPALTPDETDVFVREGIQRLQEWETNPAQQLYNFMTVAKYLYRRDLRAHYLALFQHPVLEKIRAHLSETAFWKDCSACSQRLCKGIHS